VWGRENLKVFDAHAPVVVRYNEKLLAAKLAKKTAKFAKKNKKP